MGSFATGGSLQDRFIRSGRPLLMPIQSDEARPARRSEGGLVGLRVLRAYESGHFATLRSSRPDANTHGHGPASIPVIRLCSIMSASLYVRRNRMLVVSFESLRVNVQSHASESGWLSGTIGTAKLASIGVVSLFIRKTVFDSAMM